MDWQLPDIGKTITNNIYPAALPRTQYVSGYTVILLISGSWLFPCISVLCWRCKIIITQKNTGLTSGGTSITN